MKLSDKTQAILKQAISGEIYAEKLYMSLSLVMYNLGFEGMANYFKNESDDEKEHQKIILSFLNDLSLYLPFDSNTPINAPVDSIEGALSLSLSAETDLLKVYNSLLVQANSENDYVTFNFFQQFVDIQRKAIGDVTTLIARLNKTKDPLLFDSLMD